MRVSDDISSNTLPVSVATRRRSEESTSFSEGLPNFVAETTKFRAKTNFARSPIVSQVVGSFERAVYRLQTLEQSAQTNRVRPPTS